MTDGRNTSGPDPIDAARIAANLGVRIYTIGFGTANGQLLYFGGGRGMRAVLDEDTLKRMATITERTIFPRHQLHRIDQYLPATHHQAAGGQGRDGNQRLLCRGGGDVRAAFDHPVHPLVPEVFLTGLRPRLIIPLIVAMAFLMEQLDSTIITTAVPDMARKPVR